LFGERQSVKGDAFVISLIMHLLASLTCVRGGGRHKSTVGRLVRCDRVCAVACATLAFVSACTASDGRYGAAVTVYDSAGIEIVENHAPSWAEGEGWTIDPVPLAEIGGAAGPDDDLFRVTDVRRLSDGSIVAASSSPASLYRFHPDGSLAVVLGRQGDGPGEFRSIDLLPARGDTIIAWDQRNARLTWFDPGGDVIETRRIDQAQFSRRSPFALLPDGRILAAGFDYPERPLEVGLREIPLGLDLIHPDGTRESIDVDWIEDEELIVYLDPRPVQQLLFFPPGRTDLRFAAARLFASLTLRAEIEVREPSGAFRRLIRWDAPVRLVSEQAVDERAPSMGEAVRGRDFDPAHATDIDLDEIELIHDTLPAHGGIEVDVEGNIWVHELDLSEEDAASLTRFQVFDSDGRWLGLVNLPAGLAEIEFGADYLAGVWRDEDRVEYVRVFRIIKPGG
jgi:hypothetical protein